MCVLFLFVGSEQKWILLSSTCLVKWCTSTLQNTLEDINPELLWTEYEVNTHTLFIYITYQVLELIIVMEISWKLHYVISYTFIYTLFIFTKYSNLKQLNTKSCFMPWYVIWYSQLPLIIKAQIYLLHCTFWDFGKCTRKVKMPLVVNISGLYFSRHVFMKSIMLLMSYVYA